MVNVDDYLRIRLLHRDGLSIRQIARRLGHGRETVKKALASPAPSGYTRSRPAACPKLGPYAPVIERILAADFEAPRKQRHTAMRMFERLRDEHGYGGGYDQVRRHVNRCGCAIFQMNGESYRFRESSKQAKEAREPVKK